MSTSLFKIDVVTEQEAYTVYLSGEIDYAASLKLMPLLDKLTHECECDLLFDLDEVTLIDSEGIKMLAQVFNRMYQKQRHARIVRCSERAVRIIKLAGMHELLTTKQAWLSAESQSQNGQPRRLN